VGMGASTSASSAMCPVSGGWSRAAAVAGAVAVPVVLAAHDESTRAKGHREERQRRIPAIMRPPNSSLRRARRCILVGVPWRTQTGVDSPARPPSRGVGRAGAGGGRGSRRQGSIEGKDACGSNLPGRRRVTAPPQASRIGPGLLVPAFFVRAPLRGTGSFRREALISARGDHPGRWTIHDSERSCRLASTLISSSMSREVEALLSLVTLHVHPYCLVCRVDCRVDTLTCDRGPLRPEVAREMPGWRTLSGDDDSARLWRDRCGAATPFPPRCEALRLGTGALAGAWWPLVRCLRRARRDLLLLGLCLLGGGRLLRQGSAASGSRRTCLADEAPAEHGLQATVSVVSGSGRFVAVEVGRDGRPGRGVGPKSGSEAKGMRNSASSADRCHRGCRAPSAGSAGRRRSSLDVHSRSWRAAGSRP